MAHAPEEQLAVHSGTIQQVYQSHKAMLTSDSGLDYRYAMGGQPPEAGRRSILCAPLMIGDHPLGVIHLERRTLDAYSLTDLRLFQAVANLLAVVIEQMQRLETQPFYSDTDTSRQRDESNHRVVGVSPNFKRTMDTVKRVAQYPTTALLIGETGTGKEVFAREIHRLSPQGKRGSPFIALNCAAIPNDLFESELFGHERGAFTGADRLQRGKVELAHGGTLFLDEIGELSPTLQPKLLRFLQERVFYRVGGTRPLRVELRLIAATNVDLAESVKKGSFREDLYHRISVIPIMVYPLRQRRPDIRLLAEFFASHFTKEMGKTIVGISDEAMILLERYQWPGNVRELQNTIERAVLLCDGKVILPRHLLLPGTLQHSMADHVRVAGIGLAHDETQPLTRDRYAPRSAHKEIEVSKGSESAEEMGEMRWDEDLNLENLERRVIRRALEFTQWNQVQAAEHLGIHRNTLRKKIAQYGIKPKAK